MNHQELLAGIDRHLAKQEVNRMDITPEQKVVAIQVQDAVRALNVALHEAAMAGLRVDLDVIDTTPFGAMAIQWRVGVDVYVRLP